MSSPISFTEIINKLKIIKEELKKTPIDFTKILKLYDEINTEYDKNKQVASSLKPDADPDQPRPDPFVPS